MAIIVRLSEKQILQGTLLALEATWPIGGVAAADPKKDKKRGRDEQEKGRKKSKMSL